MVDVWRAPDSAISKTDHGCGRVTSVHLAKLTACRHDRGSVNLPLELTAYYGISVSSIHLEAIAGNQSPLNK